MKQVKISILRIRQGLICLLCACCCSFSAFAQGGRAISGNVIDDKGEAIIGASVAVKGTTTGTVTDANGNFSITTTPDAVLIISYLGFKTQEVAVGNQTRIAVTLSEDSKTLDEVLVVGFGTAKRRDVVGSITKVGGDDLIKQPVVSVGESLQGLASGLMVTNGSGQPGSPTTIKVRGINSLSLSTDPLWVIDGVPMIGGNISKIGDGSLGVSALSMINPNDIESIDVLKDASATAIYGSRAAGGVVMITTKTNRTKKTNTQVGYDGGVSALSFSQNDFWADSETWFRLADEAAANFGASPVDPNNIINTAFAAYKKPSISREEAERTNTDHLGALTRQGQFHQFSLTANKGFESGGVLFSFNYRKEQGIIKNNDMDRLSGRFSFDFSPIKNVNMGVATSFTYMKQTGAESNYGKVGPGGWHKWSTVLPWFKIYDDGNPDAAQPYWGAESGMNLLAGTLREFLINDMDSYRDISNAYAEWLLPVDGLKLRGDVAADVLIANASRWQSPLVSPRNPQISEATEQSVTSAYVNYDVYANYNKTFDKHFVDFSAGWESFRNSGYSRYASGMETQSAYPGLRAPKTLLSMRGSHAGESYMMGYFARGTYKLNDRYIVNASVRRDGLSAFSKENRWATFYALGAGWILSDEPFFSGAEWLNLLKPRFSYGTTGNTNVSNSMTMTQWGLDTSSNWDYPYSAGRTTLGPLGSAGLRWEINASTDVGFDFGLLNNRINGSFAYYNQSAKDLIMRTNLAPSAGLGSVYENVGNMKNYGIEFNVSSVNIRTEDFQWKTELNFSTNKNKVLKLNAGEKLQGYVMDNAVNDAYAFERIAPKIRKEGYALNTYFMSVSAGVDPQTGIYMIEEIDQERWAKEGVTVKTGKLVPMTTNNAMNNRQVLEGKTPLPTFYGGFSNTFFYKGFDLNILFSFAGGHWIENFYYAAMHRPGFGDSGMIKDLDGNYWKKPGDIAKYPMLLTNEDYLYDDDGNPSTARYRYNTVNTDRWLEKGDFIRLRNLQLGYTLPVAVSRSIGLGNVRVYAGGSNLLLFTGFQGLDPETNWEMPLPRSFNFGVSINL